MLSCGDSSDPGSEEGASPCGVTIPYTRWVRVATQGGRGGTRGPDDEGAGHMDRGQVRSRGCSWGLH
jgi:hypothetical protein